MVHHDIDESGNSDSSFILGCYFYILGMNLSTALSLSLSLSLHNGIAAH